MSHFVKNMNSNKIRTQLNKIEMEEICRCCLSEGVHKDLDSTHVWLDRKEIYSEMLSDCFNMILHTFNRAKICEVCIKNLRSSLEFKHQVLRSEQELLRRFKAVQEKDEKPIDIKLEPKVDSGDESDDYFLADAAREASIEKVTVKIESTVKKKVKTEQKRSKSVVKKTAKASGKWRAERIKSLVTKLATTMNSCDLPDIAISKKPKELKSRKRRPITTKDSIYPTNINISWTSRSNSEKAKHKENLQTILQYSNATPFKNKSLLGFLCGYCEATYPDPKDLRTHTQVDHSKERLQFKSNFDMSEYTVKLDVTNLCCTVCDENMVNLTTLKEHLVKKHSKTFNSDIKDHFLQFKLKKGDVYDCAMCTSTYETFKMLKQHMNKHYCNYTCTKCDTSFATKRSLSAHITTHEEGSFKCDYCEKVFSSKPKKHYHEKTKHLGARNISNCPYCDQPFRSYYQRNQHLVKVHNSEAQYKCNVCNKAYILKSLLMYHIKKNHLMERNCQCSECGFRFFSKKALKAHMVKHTGERIYVCEVCKKSYARKYTLREHMRIHNNDRRFKCEVCSMSFVQKCSLKSHLLSNHGISVIASAITSA